MKYINYFKESFVDKSGNLNIKSYTEPREVLEYVANKYKDKPGTYVNGSWDKGDIIETFTISLTRDSRIEVGEIKKIIEDVVYKFKDIKFIKKWTEINYGFSNKPKQLNLVFKLDIKDIKEKNKFFNYKIDNKNYKFLISGNNFNKLPMLSRNNSMLNLFSGSAYIKGFKFAKILYRGNVYDYIKIYDRIYPTYIFEDNVNFDIHFKIFKYKDIEELNKMNYSDLINLSHNGYSKLLGDMIIHKDGLKIVKDLFEILEITEKEYIGFNYTWYPYNKDGSIDYINGDKVNKYYNFIE